MDDPLRAAVEEGPFRQLDLLGRCARLESDCFLRETLGFFSFMQTSAKNWIYLAIGAIIVAVLAIRARSGSECLDSVRVIPIIGDITAMQYAGSSTAPYADADSMLSALQSADKDPRVKAIVLSVDSNGGDGQAAEEVVQEMDRIHKPKYALIRSAGDSAAYWIASAADKIFAFKVSNVGSIGVTGSYLSNSSQSSQDGDQFVSLASGPYKDTGNPDKPLTPADRAYLMKGVMGEFDIFVASVASHRGMTVEKVKAIADGSSMLGGEALKAGLIDSDGGRDTLWQTVSKDLGISCYSTR